MVTNGNICTLYRRLNNLISYQQISWQYQLTQQLVQAAVDGSIDCIKIKSAGSGGSNGTHSVTIKGDGSSATANVVVSGGTITSVTMTNVGEQVILLVQFQMQK